MSKLISLITISVCSLSNLDPLGIVPEITPINHLLCSTKHQMNMGNQHADLYTDLHATVHIPVCNNIPTATVTKSSHKDIGDRLSPNSSNSDMQLKKKAISQCAFKKPDDLEEHKIIFQVKMTCKMTGTSFHNTGSNYFFI